MDLHFDVYCVCSFIMKLMHHSYHFFSLVRPFVLSCLNACAIFLFCSAKSSNKLPKCSRFITKVQSQENGGAKGTGFPRRQWTDFIQGVWQAEDIYRSARPISDPQQRGTHSDEGSKRQTAETARRAQKGY